MSDERQEHPGASDEQDIGPGIAQPTVGVPHRAILAYAVGLAVSILLTAASFYVTGTRLIWGPAIPVALVVLAIAQIGVHLVFFLHITTAPDNTNNVLALAFGVLIVALIMVGSLWIMAHLNHNMLDIDQLRHLQR